MQKMLMIVISFFLFPCAVLLGCGNSTYKPYTEEELNSIKAGNNPKLIMGAGIIIHLHTNSKASVGKELLYLGSQIESPKGPATVSLIIHQLNIDYNNLSMKSLRENIIELLQDDKDNALSYYLNALLMEEKIGAHKALAEIKKGNEKTLNTYARERFDAITQAAKMANYSSTEARSNASLVIQSVGLFIRLRYLCKKLVEDNDEDAIKACFLLGQKLERESLSLLEKINSLAIQSVSIGDSPTYADARAEIKKKSDHINACVAIDLSEAVATEDADQEYYEIWLTKGECAAREFLVKFVKM